MPFRETRAKCVHMLFYIWNVNNRIYTVLFVVYVEISLLSGHSDAISLLGNNVRYLWHTLSSTSSYCFKFSHEDVSMTSYIVIHCINYALCFSPVYLSQQYFVKKKKIKIKLTRRVGQVEAGGGQHLLTGDRSWNLSIERSKLYLYLSLSKLLNTKKHRGTYTHWRNSLCIECVDLRGVLEGGIAIMFVVWRQCENYPFMLWYGMHIFSVDLFVKDECFHEEVVLSIAWLRYYYIRLNAYIHAQLTRNIMWSKVYVSTRQLELKIQ